jgi:hypothetical protein
LKIANRVGSIPNLEIESELLAKKRLLNNQREIKLLDGSPDGNLTNQWHFG